MDRYQDNTSPEPTITNLSCYKTPEYTSYQTNQYQYPTPPSDTEDDYRLSSDKQSPTTFYQTEKPVTQTNSSRFKRRSRTTFSKQQLDTLEQTFLKAQYPEIKIVDDLSNLLNLSTERISIWFQNRRARFKKARKLHAQENGYSSENVNFNQLKYNVYEPTVMQPLNQYSTYYSTNPLSMSKQENYSLNKQHVGDVCLNKTNQVFQPSCNQFVSNSFSNVPYFQTSNQMDSKYLF